MQTNLTPVVRSILIINILIYFFEVLANFDLANLFGLRDINAETFKPYQFVTYMFLHSHANTMHLVSNMFGLFIFGPTLEKIWGSNRFLFFYMFIGIGAGLLNIGINYYEASKIQQAISIYSQYPSPESFIGFLNKYGQDITLSSYEHLQKFRDSPNDPNLINETINFVKGSYQQIINGGVMIGASGAIFGILMAFGYLFPNTEMMIMFVPAPIKAKYLITFYALYELYSGVNKAPGDNIAHYAHLGGMLFAIILLKFWGNSRNNFY
jgi:membrane associated rhomboid family serine protease